MQLVGQSFDLEPLWAETNSHLRVALIQCRFPWRVSSLSLPLVISTPGAFIVVLWNVPEWKTPLFFTCKSLLSSPTASPFLLRQQTDRHFLWALNAVSVKARQPLFDRKKCFRWTLRVCVWQGKCYGWRYCMSCTVCCSSSMFSPLYHRAVRDVCEGYIIIITLIEMVKLHHFSQSVQLHCQSIFENEDNSEDNFVRQLHIHSCWWVWENEHLSFGTTVVSNFNHRARYSSSIINSLGTWTPAVFEIPNKPLNQSECWLTF